MYSIVFCSFVPEPSLERKEGNDGDYQNALPLIYGYMVKHLPSHY